MIKSFLACLISVTLIISCQQPTDTHEEKDPHIVHILHSLTSELKQEFTKSGQGKEYILFHFITAVL